MVAVLELSPRKLHRHFRPVATIAEAAQNRDPIALSGSVWLRLRQQPPSSEEGKGKFIASILGW